MQDCQPEPKWALVLAWQSLLFRVAVHHVKGSNVGIGGWTRHSFVCLTIGGVVQGPHAGPITMVQAPVILFAFEGFHECVAFFAI